MKNMLTYIVISFLLVTTMYAHKLTPTTFGGILGSNNILSGKEYSYTGAFSEDDDNQNGGQTPRWYWVWDYQGTMDYNYTTTNVNTTHIYNKGGTYTCYGEA